MGKGGYKMKRMARVVDFMEKLEFQGYTCSPVQIESDVVFIKEKYQTWINVRGMPIMRAKEIFELIKSKNHPILNPEFIRKNNHVFWKHKQRRKWKDSRGGSFREELYLLRHLKKHPEPFVTINLYVVVESDQEFEIEKDSSFIQSKLMSAGLSALALPKRHKKDSRLPLVISVKRKEEESDQIKK